MKDYQELVGQKYGYLLVEEILPRERDAKGALKPARAICLCVCGKRREFRCVDLTGNSVRSCGCKKGNHNPKYKIPKADMYKCWHCKYPEPSCTYATVMHICCHECPLKPTCNRSVCQNEPTKCGATYGRSSAEAREFIYGEKVFLNEKDDELDAT